MRPALLLAALALCSCVGTRRLAHPTLDIRTEHGRELGVSTDHGIVFLGRTARSGPIDVTAWFGDGPSIEPSVIEPIAPGVCTAETEIRLPSVPLWFDDPRPGDELLLIGRRDGELWERKVTVRSDPRVHGILIDPPPEMRGRPDQIGAGLYVLPEGDREKLSLVGLVSGSVTLRTDQGERELLAVAGPQQLWRLVTHRRDVLRRRPWVYREDVL